MKSLNKNSQFVGIIAIVLVVMIALAGVYILIRENLNSPNAQTSIVQPSVAFDPLNASYMVEDEPITLINGETNDKTYAIVGSFAKGDLVGGSQDGAAGFLVHRTAGSGSFYYVIAALSSASGTQGTNAVYLGDRITPQNIQISNKEIIANYADRLPTEPMSATSTVNTTVYLKVEGDELKKIVEPPKEVSYVISQEDTRKYCNGVDMDSAGYVKTITHVVTTSTVSANITTEQMIKKIIDAATTGMCRTVLNQLDITEHDGTVTIPPIDAWAGISIEMCSCKPQVEVNMLRLPGVKNVVWE